MLQKAFSRPSARTAPASQLPGFAGKIRRLRLFPMHTLTVRTGIAQFLHGIRTKRAQRWIARKGYLSLTQRRHDGALPQDPADLRFLYEAIVRQQPQRAIELGSGQSTIFIAQALHDVGAGHLWSLDADAG